MDELKREITDPVFENLLRCDEVLRLACTDQSGNLLINPIAKSIFFYVASHAPCHKKAVEIDIGISTASSSRNTDLLSAEYGKGQKGLSLIKKEVDPTNNRRQILSLTKKGKQLAKTMKNILYAKMS